MRESRLQTGLILTVRNRGCKQRRLEAQIIRKKLPFMVQMEFSTFSTTPSKARSTCGQSQQQTLTSQAPAKKPKTSTVDPNQPRNTTTKNSSSITQTHKTPRISKILRTQQLPTTPALHQYKPRPKCKKPTPPTRTNNQEAPMLDRTIAQLSQGWIRSGMFLGNSCRISRS